MIEHMLIYTHIFICLIVLFNITKYTQDICSFIKNIKYNPQTILVLYNRIIQNNCKKNIFIKTCGLGK